MRIFMDTGAFIALTDSDDENHNAARKYYKDSIDKGTRFTTTNFVICETMNYLRAKVSYEVAVIFWENLKKSRILEIININPLIENTAFTIFKQYADKDFSFTDCTSFAAMKPLKLTKAFAFDKHFAQYDNYSRVP
jgi:uncharacterized protein